MLMQENLTLLSLDIQSWESKSPNFNNGALTKKCLRFLNATDVTRRMSKVFKQVLSWTAIAIRTKIFNVVFWFWHGFLITLLYLHRYYDVLHTFCDVPRGCKITAKNLRKLQFECCGKRRRQLWQHWFIQYYICVYIGGMYMCTDRVYAGTRGG